MKTYQDLLDVGENEKDRMEFVLSAINEHKSSDLYKTAVDADLYARQMNPTIMNYQKLLYTIAGEAVPDNYSANHKCASNFFYRFMTQLNQYQLGNGVSFEKEDTKEKLGKKFDTKVQDAGYEALCGAVSFGFWNYDHLEVFSVREFIPLYDEEDGALKAGIRFWQIDDSKPLRATLYELDGYTEYIKKNDEETAVRQEKQSYKHIIRSSDVSGDEIIDGGNYEGFPIVPLWGNKLRQSELIGLREHIDSYDLIKSGFANDLDDCSQIYWIIKNAGGMDEKDLQSFVDRLRRVKATNVDGGDEGATAEAHTIEVPYQSRETYLTRLENDMYNDAMILNVQQIAAGNITATQIDAAYEAMNSKADQYEYCLIEFIEGILKLAGIDDTPKFTRSKIANQLEETQMILSAGLDQETTIEKLPFLTPEEKTLAKSRMIREETARFPATEEVVEE